MVLTILRAWKTSKGITYTLCGSDVDVAAYKGQTIIHAHLEKNHPETGWNKEWAKALVCEHHNIVHRKHNWIIFFQKNDVIRTWVHSK